MALKRLAIFVVMFLFIMSRTVIAEELILGFYAFPDKKYIDLIADSNIKYLIPYGTDGNKEEVLRNFLDYASSRNVKIIFSLKDCYKQSKWYPKISWCPAETEETLVSCIVNKFKDEPALYGWYVADEPTDTVGFRNREKIHTNIKAIRNISTKPVFIEDYPLPRGKLWDELSGWVDIFITGVYPVPEKPLSEVYEAIKGLTKRHKNPVVAVIQAHGKYQYPFYKRDENTGRPPTLEELRVMSYLALMAGAKGIVYYSIFDVVKLPDFKERLEFLKGLAKELETNYQIISSKEDFSVNQRDIREGNVFCISRKFKRNDYLICVNSAGFSAQLEILTKGIKEEIQFYPYEIKIINLSKEN